MKQKREIMENLWLQFDAEKAKTMLKIGKSKKCHDLPQCRVVAFFRLLDESFLLESIGQIAVGIWEIRLELNGSSVRINGQVNQSTE